MSAQLARFKEQLEQDCRIAQWAPTSVHLHEIARRIASAKQPTVGIAHQAVVSVCPGTTFAIEEGVDNSDIRVVLALATLAASVAPKANSSSL